MKTKLLKGALTRIAATAIAAVFFTPVASAAVASGDMENPVTGETETYVNTFTGSGGTTEWNSADNWDTGSTPFISGGNYDPALVNGQMTVSTSTAIDGWTLRVGAYNGAQVTWAGGISKIQAGSVGCWLTADETSSITIASFVGYQLEGSDSAPFKLSSAKAGGITWSAGLTAASNTTLPFWYYLSGVGTVVYGGDITAANAPAIKQADITLSGTSQVASKTLVTFGSGTTKTFTADATIKRFTTVGGDLEDLSYDAHLATVTSGATTLTTADAVGTCELVQTTTGIVLYWVDGDPDDMPPPTVYKPSININFTHSGSGLTTAADVGLAGYEVPGTSWNNFAGANGTYSTVKAVDDTGAASVLSGVSVAVSGTRGSYSCSALASASNPLHGYIDENGNNMTPTVTVTGIPYYKYRVLVYHATDTENVPFGYDTINGTNYTYENDALTEGTTAWGNSGADYGANAIAEGGNVLLTGELSGSTLTVVGHRAGGASNARGCIAAIQIIEVKPDAGENDLIIEVSGDTTYTVNEAKTPGTVYITGAGTLTLNGSAKISAATNNVGASVTLNVNDACLDATTYTGAGTVVYDGTKPETGKGWTDAENWSGTVWVKNISTSSNDRKDWNLALYGNANSTLRFTDVNLYFPNNTTTAFPGTVELDGAGMNVCDGYGGSIATIARLTGSGTLSTTDGSANGNGLTINDASAFTGTITLTKYKVIIGTATGTSASGVLQIESGKSITVAGATAPGGFVVNGTLVANGTLASSASAAVTGSGTVVFGGVPSPVDGENETKWWKNVAWTGTVEIKGATNITGTGYAFNDYGNAGSTVKLTNCSGWLTHNYTCVPALEIGGTFSWTDGYSGLNNTFKVGTLKGSGTISIPNSGAATAVWQITDDWSGFTGAVVGNNTAAKRVLVFGSTLPTTVTAGEIYISEGATLNLDNSSAAWWGVGMGFVVDGTVKASSRSKWGGGTYMTLGDTGVLELVSTSNTDDQNTEMGNITGTGTLKFSSSAGWRSFPKTDANMPATTLTIQTELADSLVLPTKNDGETIIGNLAGSKNIRSDWSDNGANGRILTVTQSKDTEWQGKFVANRITQFNVVAPAAGTAGTLTLSGTQASTIPMQIDGAVNLTGTWVGAATVAGTVGGTGTLSGNLTLTDGATIKVNDISDPLEVSGSLTVTGAITIELPEGAGKGMIFTTGSKPDITGATFTTMVGGVERKLKVTATANGLKFGAQSLLIRIR